MKNNHFLWITPIKNEHYMKKYVYLRRETQ